MKDPVLNGTTVKIGPVRLAYVHLFEKYNPDNTPDGGKYEATILLPKDEKKTLDAIRSAIEAAKTKGIAAKWGGKVPANLATPVKNGDDNEKGGEAFNGCWSIRGKSAQRVVVVDGHNQPMSDPEEMYSGVWAYVQLNFFPYKTSGNAGVGCVLQGVRKFKDDDRLGGGGVSFAEFDDDGADIFEC